MTKPMTDERLRELRAMLTTWHCGFLAREYEEEISRLREKNVELKGMKDQYYNLANSLRRAIHELGECSDTEIVKLRKVAEAVRLFRGNVNIYSAAKTYAVGRLVDLDDEALRELDEAET